eukprot:m.51778 g.51778  ORF g.51778 m.51778 type:complete len:127 (+) comp13021_c0_seq2:357-737(+)
MDKKEDKRKRVNDDSDGDSDDLGDNNSDPGSKADKRAHHNALERKRRDHIKDSFTVLRDAIPSLSGEKVTASRAQILNRATDFIQQMKKRNAAHAAEMEELKRVNAQLQQQSEAMRQQRSAQEGSS